MEEFCKGKFYIECIYEIRDELNKKFYSDITNTIISYLPSYDEDDYYEHEMYLHEKAICDNDEDD